jgi:hypothetical protein
LTFGVVHRDSVRIPRGTFIGRGTQFGINGSRKEDRRN